MPMKNKKKQQPSKKNKKLNLQIMVSALVLVVGLALVFTLNTPDSSAYDLSVINEGKNVIVQVHDPA